MTRGRWQVHKFGGTSVADADRIRRAAEVFVRQDGVAHRAVIVSALAGVTDELLALLDSACCGEGDVDTRLQALRDRHVEVIDSIAHVDDQESLHAFLDETHRDLHDLLRSVSLTRAVPRETLELVSGHGELWSASIFASHLRGTGTDAAMLDARLVLILEESETGPRVDWDASQSRLDAWRLDHDVAHVVVTGFVAATATGRPTTLGRNGSDYSAAIFAALLDATALTIWTDVDGVMSADPRRVPEAQVIPRLSYDEALELAYFGASILHPNTMSPLVDRGIVTWIRNSLRPEGQGTEIGPRAEAPSEEEAHGSPVRAVRGFTTVEDMSLINVEGSGLIGVPGIAERLFGALRSIEVSVTMISQASSEHSICFAVPTEQAARARTAVERAFFAELTQGLVGQVDQRDGCTVLAAVGDAMAATPGVAARFFGSLAAAGVNVRAVAQGSSERNITAVIDSSDGARALRAAHAGFFLSDRTISVGIVGVGTVGKVLLDQIEEQRSTLHERFNIDLRVRGIAASRRMLVSDRGQEAMSVVELDAVGEATDLGRFVDHIKASHLPHAVIIDCTASEGVASQYAQWLERGIHVITPNKKASSGPQASYDHLGDLTLRHRARYLYETTVGAALPILQTLRDLVQTGDTVYEIEGVLSGTLSYLFNAYTGEQPFSELVAEARKAGYTEPDPRDDLSGTDVARKLIILARELGQSIELEDVQVENLVPADLRSVPTVDEFLSGLAEHDADLTERCRNVRDRGQVLRYVGRIDREGRASVELRELDAHHPFAHLVGADNCLSFTTERYSDLPLIVRGPGAGPDVTAAGVFADLLRLASSLS